MTITELKQTAVEVRKGIVTATHAAKSGHPGQILTGHTSQNPLDVCKFHYNKLL